ncbi:MAG: ATP-binding protein [Rhodanobacter lindaniclasticus]
MTDLLTTAATDATVAMATTNSEERISEFRLDIASGMLESLGLNMYTSIGKSLSEFVANAFDADATKVEISIPFEDIDIERERLRAAAKGEVEAGTREKFTVLVDPLPDHIQISIVDDGHGMLPLEIKNKLLVVSRNRRKGSARSESGTRFVMGRKGLGKLAGFGTAEKITIRSKRIGTTLGSTPILRTLSLSPILGQRSVHVQAQALQP